MSEFSKLYSKPRKLDIHAVMGTRPPSAPQEHEMTDLEILAWLVELYEGKQTKAKRSNCVVCAKNPNEKVGSV